MPVPSEKGSTGELASGAEAGGSAAPMAGSAGRNFADLMWLAITAVSYYRDGAKPYGGSTALG